MLAERIETWFEEATRKGMERGEARGILKGEARLLVRLLERRFGPLPSWARERIAAAEAQLEAWGEAVLTAGSLDALFGAGS